ncbi:MAG TPA: hypothetical protein ENN39_13150 [Desulfonatronum sp.]|nr:hypothetical protein [Desulfonatronum sp.]
MPGFDGTGPRGQGPMTGGGFGYCASGGYAQGVARGGGLGRGRGQGRGFGRGFGRCGFFGGAPYGGFVQLSETDEKTFLESRLKWLEQEKSRISERLGGLQS